MQQNFIVGNSFQTHMNAQFNHDMNSASIVLLKIRGKEQLVYDYIKQMGSVFKPPQHKLNGNPSNLYADFNLFKKNFVNYWRRAWGVSKEETQRLEKIFDDSVFSQEQARRSNTTSVFFEEGTALTIDDCLNAVYEVIESL